MNRIDLNRQNALIGDVKRSSPPIAPRAIPGGLGRLGGDILLVALSIPFLAIGVAFLLTATQPVLAVVLAMMLLPAIAPAFVLLVLMLYLRDDHVGGDNY
jgi:hypothetical protein